MFTVKNYKCANEVIFLEIINEQGFKIFLNEENGQIDIQMNPEEAPYSPPGFVAYECSGNGYNLIQSRGVFTVECKLQLEGDYNTEVVYNSKRFIISLLVDPNNSFISEIQVINSQDVNQDYEKLNKEFFKVAIQTINNLSITYQQPIKLGNFLILHSDFSVFTFMDQKQPIENNFRGLIMGKFIDEAFFQHAADNYRKFMNSTDPITRYLSLYICIDSLRALIRKVLGLYPPVTGRINHPRYTEPVLREDFALNGSSSRLQIEIGKEFYDLLYADKHVRGTLRNLRNSAAHTITNEGHFRLTDNLDDYLDYQSALPYLHHMYVIYLRIIIDLYKESNEVNC